MKLHIIAVRDRAADVYGQPQFVASVGMAIRSFSDEINRDAADNILSKHPEDFDLFLLGLYDDQSASFDVDSPPRQLAVGKDVSTRLKAS